VEVWFPIIGVIRDRPEQGSGENPEWIARTLGHANTDMLFREMAIVEPLSQCKHHRRGDKNSRNDPTGLDAFDRISDAIWKLLGRRPRKAANHNAGKPHGVGLQIAQKTTEQAQIGFAIVGGNTWKVYTATINLATQTTVASGPVPATAVTVQNTWTLLGVPAGDQTSGGAVVNYASSPIALSSNPFSDYTTTAFGGNSVARGAIYQLTVIFFNAAGANVSTSTATMTANIVGSE
jgi:hypothetical protein